MSAKKSEPQATFKFESGIEIPIKRIPTDLYGDLKKANPAPKPPIKEFQGPGGTRSAEDLYDQYYQDMTTIYYIGLAEEFRNLVAILGTDFTLTDDRKAEVDSVREQYTEMGLPLNFPDKLVYLRKIAAGGSTAEMERLQVAIQQLGQATPGVIADKQEAFRS
jgi:hypothetical protein